MVKMVAYQILLTTQPTTHIEYATIVSQAITLVLYTHCSQSASQDSPTLESVRTSLSACQITIVDMVHLELPTRCTALFSCWGSFLALVTAIRQAGLVWKVTGGSIETYFLKVLIGLLFSTQV